MSYATEFSPASAELELNDNTVNSILDAYSDHAYQQGYARATRDLLAIYPLLIEQYLVANRIKSPDLRRAIRGVGEYIENTVDRKLSDAGFVNDGLGI